MSVLTIREEIQMYGIERVNDIKVLAELSGAKEEDISPLFKEWGTLNRVCKNIEFNKSLTKRQVEKIIMIGELMSRNINHSHDTVFRISQPEHIYKLIEDIKHNEQENFVLLCLNTKNELIKRIDLFKGGRKACVVDTSVLFKEVLKYGSSAIVIAHNHPSGNPEPSNEDISLTRRIVDGGRILNIRVLDHVIVSPRRNLSLKQEGLMD